MMLCTCSREQFKFEEVPQSPESLATRDFSASGISSRTGDGESRLDDGSIEEAESSLREALSLNYEEARALLGRLEYQRGNIEAALQVFEGIDINAITPKMKRAIAVWAQRRRGRSRSESKEGAPAMSMHAVSLLLEAIFLKAKSLQELGLVREAAQECKIVLDTVESALPYGMPEAFGDDSKLQDTVSKAVELLPELWKQAGLFHEAIAAYRRALINPWSLDSESSARIQKEFAIFLLYGGIDAGPPSLGLQLEAAFIPRNNTEEAILLLLILLKKFILRKIGWDPTVMDHLTFALSMSGQFGTLASHIEEVVPGVYKRSDRWYILALCYSAAGQNEVALDLLRKILGPSEKLEHVPALLLAAKLCGQSSKCAHEGVHFARRALESSKYNLVDHMKGVANHLLGVSLGKQARTVVSDSERDQLHREALTALEEAALNENKDPEVMFSLGLENAEQRSLNVALDHVKKFLDMMAGASVKGWRLLALILSAQQRFSDAEIIIDAALDETGKWEQGQLLRSKAKLQLAQGQSARAIETYRLLLALVQAQRKSSRAGNWKLKGGYDLVLEVEAWQDLAYAYISLGQWHDGHICLDKAKAIKPHSSIRWHATGLLYEAQGLYKEALVAFSNALAIEPDHVPSMVSTAVVLRQLRKNSLPVAKSFLRDALRIEPTNHSAWFNLGIICRTEGFERQAADYFQAAFLLQQSAPLEKFC